MGKTHFQRREGQAMEKDVNCDNGTPDLYSVSGNEYDGEPDMPIRMYYPDFEI